MPNLQAAGRPLSFGLTPVMVDTDYGLIENWLTYLSRKMGQEVTITRRRSYQDIVTLVRYGVVDFAWICGYPYVNNEDSLKLVAVPRYRGKPLYQSYLIVPVTSGETDLLQLRENIHAFSDIDSNSGHLIPRFLLSQLKTTPERFFSTYFFTYSHENVIRAVASGLADSGSVDGYIWDAINASSTEMTGRTKVIHRSEYYGFPPIVALRSFPDRRLKRLQDALTGMSEDPEGRKILKALFLDGFSVEEPKLFDGIRKIKGEVERFQRIQIARAPTQ